MYTQYFQLREVPFSITPDPAYLYMSPRHQEALGHLLYGTGQYGGFVQLTGEVGTGKTTIVRALLEQKLAGVDVAMIHNPRQGEMEFVHTLCDELHVDYAKRGVTLKGLVDALNAHLLTAHAAGRRTVLIIDEAQNLQPQVLEQVRLLTNLETHKEKLLRIMLIGQPELADLLSRPDLRQLAQRITARYHLTPLSEQETAEYIGHRLRVAGTQQEIFLPAAVREIHRRAQGIPRLINIICDRALLGAYAAGVRQVDADMARRAADESMDNRTIPATGESRLLTLLRRSEIVFAPLAVVLTGILAYQIVSDRWAPRQVVVHPPPVEAKVAPVIATAAAQRAPYQFKQIPQPLPVVMARLVALWQPGFSMGPADNICDALKRKQLECLKSHGDWTELRQLNRPAVLSLNGQDGATRYVLLRALDDKQATFDTAMGPQSFPREQVTPLWSGEFLILWRRDTDAPSIGPKTRGVPVQWLRERLASLRGITLKEPVAERYDADLRQQINSFQATRGIPATGIVGVRTMIALGDGDPGTPKLAAPDPLLAEPAPATTPPTAVKTP